MAPTLVVMAAGMGSRFGGTKQLAGVGPSGETILDYSVHDAISAGFGKVVFVIRKAFADAFEQGIGARYSHLIDVAYVYQELDNLPAGCAPDPDRTKPWGTAHAVWCARPEVSGRFAVINADDFYGQDAFAQMAAYLSAVGTEAGQYAMVAFEVDGTLSPFGSVSRGVCKVDSARNLVEVTEHTALIRSDLGVVSTFADASTEVLPFDTLVSMNFWGFTTDFLEHTEDFFVQFYSVNHASSKAECYLPGAVTHLMQSGTATVKVLGTSGRWFGLTYPDDRDAVVSALAAYTEQGVYPSPLVGEALND